jgi:nucleoside-diphosphate-sugar epimerase
MRLLLAAALAACVWLGGAGSAFNVLLIGGTRFSGAYLWSELFRRGHSVTLYNRGKTSPKRLPRESEAEFAQRLLETKMITGDRKDAAVLKALIDPKEYDYVFDMNGRERSDTEPLVEIFRGSGPFGRRLKQLVYMSSAGVYLKGEEMPHLEPQAVDPTCRHKGKLDTEEMLRASGLPWCSFRPTYITGPQNYNPVERYFLARVDAGRPVCIPGHGQHLTGLGHVEDLAVAMANVIGREDRTTGQVYNLQAETAVSFDGMAKAAAKAIGKPAELVHYNAKAVKDKLPEKKKAFPLREQHFWTGVRKAKKELDWEPKYNSVDDLFRDAYENDFKLLKESGKLSVDFECDDVILRELGWKGSAGAPSSSSAAKKGSGFSMGDQALMGTDYGSGLSAWVSRGL